MTSPQALRQKVDALLGEALAAKDDTDRLKLIRKAGYWHEVATRAAESRAELAAPSCARVA